MRWPAPCTGAWVMPLHSEHDRLQAYVDGALPESERVLFQARLGHEPALAEALLLMAREEGIYAEWALGRATLTAILHEANTHNEPAVPATRQTSRRSRVRRVAIACATLAALVIVAI